MALTKSRNRWKFIRWPRIIIAKAILRLCGWKYNYAVSKNITKAVMVVAPHTSNWDFILGRLCYNALDIRVRFMIKKESFVFPLNLIIRAWGGVPVDRKNPGNIAVQMAAQFAKYDELVLGITPEGTRKPNPHWKKGFYRIAMQANVPMILTYLDYKKKFGFVGKVVIPSGDYAADMKIMSEFFAECTPCNPEGYVTPQF
ncbi:MAG: 1-acyl-sn-glycerol-3-phosphate acyltransferase [Bacteroidales bacterium]